MTTIISSFTNFRKLSGHSEQQFGTFKGNQSNLQYTDVVLVCGDGKQIQAHSLVIKAVSGLMEALLADYAMIRAGPATTSAFVYLPDFNGDCVQTFLELIYRGQTRVESKKLFFQVSDLMEILGAKAVRLEKPTWTSSQRGQTRPISNDQDVELLSHNASDQEVTDDTIRQAVVNPRREQCSSSGTEDHSTTIIDLGNSSSDETNLPLNVTPRSSNNYGHDTNEVANGSMTSGYELVFNDCRLPLERTLQKELPRKKLKRQSNDMNTTTIGRKRDDSRKECNSKAGPNDPERVVSKENTCKESTRLTEETSTPNNFLRRFTSDETLMAPMGDVRIKLRRIDDPDSNMTCFDASSQSIRQEAPRNDFLNNYDSPSTSFKHMRNSESSFEMLPTGLICPLPLCLKAFSNTSNLQNHCSSHFVDRIRSDYLNTEGDETRCPKCEYTSDRTQSMVRHIANTHRVIIDYFREMGITSDLFQKRRTTESGNVKE